MTLMISSGIQQKLTESEFNDGYLMLTRLRILLQPTGSSEFMRLSKEYHTLQLKDFKTVSEYLTHIKVLEEKIDATKVILDMNNRTIFYLSMSLPQEYRYLVQTWVHADTAQNNVRYPCPLAKEKDCTTSFTTKANAKEHVNRSLAESISWTALRNQSIHNTVERFIPPKRAKYAEGSGRRETRRWRPNQLSAHVYAPPAEYCLSARTLIQTRIHAFLAILLSTQLSNSIVIRSLARTSPTHQASRTFDKPSYINIFSLSLDHYATQT